MCIRDRCNIFNESLIHLQNNHGLISKKWIPRNPVLIVFSASWYFIQQKERRLRYEYISNLDRWYWCNMFNEKFDGSTITPIAEEFVSILEWFDDNNIPKTVKNFKVQDLELDNTYKSDARYKSVMCLLIMNGLIDFFDGKPIKDYPDKLDDHHIFPSDYLRINKHLTSDKEINCILNRTLIHKSTNRSKRIGNIPPAEYLSEVKKRLGNVKFRQLCQSHLIEEDTNSNVYNNYSKFLKSREKKIKNIIKQSTGIAQ